jgi:iron(III) transport system ATP-binding protein
MKMDLVVENLHKSFRSGANPMPAVGGVSFTVSTGTFFTLLGPSGSGKTTILRCIGGLEIPDEGEIRLGDKIYYSDRRRIALMPEERGIGMVFQSYAIWPHMTVFNNVAFPLKYGLRRVARSEIKARVSRVLDLVQMAGLAERMATQLSGGQQQRVALARALVADPDLLLLDEPLSNLDAKLREDMRLEIRHIQQSLGLTTIYVTHDQAEALSMSDRVALLRGGEIVQLGGPRDLYDRPNDVFASAFIGTSNQLPGEILAGSLGSVKIKGRDIACVRGAGCPAQGKVIVSVRPEDIDIRPANGGDTPAWRGTVRQVVYFGDSVNCEIDFDGTVLRARLHPSTVLKGGQEVAIEFRAERCVALPAEGQS